MVNIKRDKKYSPDFIGIGAMRCGTTWVADKLRSHPGIYIPPNFKELHYFDKFYRKGIDWYEDHFSNKKENQIAGEFTPKYLRDEIISSFIYKDYPNVKLIISLRDPVKRAYSHYNFLKKHSSISNDFYDALFDDNYEILKAGLYGKQITTYLTLFPRENIHIIMFDDIINSPEAVVKELYKFLDVSMEFIPKGLTKILNKKNMVRSNIISRSIRKTKQYFRPKSASRRVIRYLGLYHFFKLVQILNSKNYVEIEIDQKTENYLKDYYHEDLLILNKLLDGKVSHWI